VQGGVVRAAIYARVSSKPQASEDKVSIPDQIRRAKEVVERDGWHLVSPPFVDAGISGTAFEKRPGLQAMLTLAQRRGFDVLVVYDHDRLSRKARVNNQIRDILEANRIQVHSVCQPTVVVPPGEYNPEKDDTGFITKTITGMSSELFIRSLVRRLQTGRRNSVSQGKIISVPPYGCRFVYQLVDGRPVKKMVPHPQGSRLVQRMFREYVARSSCFRIACDMNREGLRTPSGTPWAAARVNATLRNVTYCGYTRWNIIRYIGGKDVHQDESQWESFKGKHPAIVEKRVFDQVTALRNARRVVGGRAVGNPSNPFGGLLKCGHFTDLLLANICTSSRHSLYHQHTGFMRKVKVHQDLPLGAGQALRVETIGPGCQGGTTSGFLWAAVYVTRPR
jgi:site-specific DNA recombinase